MATGESVDMFKNDNFSGKSKNSDMINKVECKLKYKSVKAGVLDTLFSAMSPGLKSHMGFILVDTSGSASCNICSVTIEPITSVSEHLKTKIHEDNTIMFLKENLPPDLHQMMDFVSFYGSNLCCNLCRCKIDLCSDNSYKTIVNIMAHNTGQSHLRKKTNSESNVKSDKALEMLKSLARLSPLVNNNKHFIDHKLQPQFKCKLCNTNIRFDENVDTLLMYFYAHLSSAGHNKCLAASSVLKTYEESRFPGKEKHSFIVSNCRIYCSLCNCYIEANYEELVLHVSDCIRATSPRNKPTDLVSKLNKMSESSPSTSSNTLPSISRNHSVESDKKGCQLPFLTKETVPNNVLNGLLNSLPVKYQNISYIVSNENGQVTCLICQCIIPATIYNLQTHLTGSNHKKNEQKVNESVNKINEGLIKSPLVQQSSQGNYHYIAVKKLNATCQETKSGRNIYVDDLFRNIMKTEKVLQCFAKFFVKKNENYFCTLCKSTIIRSYDEQSFKNNLLGHVKGQKHTKYLDKVLENMLEKLQLSHPVIRDNKTLIKKQEDHFYCTLCACTIPSSIEEKNLRKCLLLHLEGSRHLSNKGESDQNTSSPSPANLFKSLADPVKERFTVLPHRFQEDIVYINKAQVEGYFSCALCCCIINPHYLRHHLEDEKHIQRRVLNTNPRFKSLFKIRLVQNEM